MVSDLFICEVSALSIAARLAIALCCVESYCRVRRLHHPEIDAFLEHLWEFPSLRPGKAFGEWERRMPGLVSAGLGCEYPAGFGDFLAAQKTSESDFRSLLRDTAEIVFWGAHGEVDDLQSRQFLLEVVEAVSQNGVQPPPVSLFAESRWRDGNSWGIPVPHETVLQWRQLSTLEQH
jgi:hypothetical protein